jgi:tRNA nucleotidyltransferase/poly(A) polymerase
MQDPVLRFFRTRKEEIYLVGGAVRDLLLERPTLHDLDVTTSEDPHELAHALETRGLATVVRASDFLTVKLQTKDGRELDLARFRRETYPEPGALPVVEPAGSIEEDLLRRDFTINALAVGLSGKRFGEIVDVVGGLKDLERRWVRPLHSRSFQEDPTRALRGMRYAHRLGFRLHRAFLRQVPDAREGLRKISFARVRAELIRAEAEPRPGRLFWKLARKGLGLSWLPDLRASKAFVCLETRDNRWVAYAALAYLLAAPEHQWVPAAHLTRKERTLLEAAIRVAYVNEDRARFLEVPEVLRTVYACAVGEPFWAEFLRRLYTRLPAPRVLMEWGVPPHRIREVQEYLITRAWALDIEFIVSVENVVRRYLAEGGASSGERKR